MVDLSIIIPARNEKFLDQTIIDVLEHSESEVEVIVVLDGDRLSRPNDSDRVKVIDLPKPVGLRVAMNEGVKIARGEYVMKLDAHCSLSQGFDGDLICACEPDCTVVPTLRALDAPTWTPRPWTSSRWSLSPNLAMQYESNLDNGSEIDETMAVHSACWIMERNRHWALGGLDPGYGAWGLLTAEVSLKSWLSGGRLLVHKEAWCAHIFRSVWPYKPPPTRPGLDYAKSTWFGDHWNRQTRPLSWLVEKFKPIPGWHDTEEGRKIVCSL